MSYASLIYSDRALLVAAAVLLSLGVVLAAAVGPYDLAQRFGGLTSAVAALYTFFFVIAELRFERSMGKLKAEADRHASPLRDLDTQVMYSIVQGYEKDTTLRRIRMAKNVAIVACLGELFGAAGDRIVSLAVAAAAGR